MRYKLFGKTGLRVSELCLGTMTFGNESWGADEDTAGKIYDQFRDVGGNFVDTANELYAGGESERILGRLVRSHRDEVVLATKYTLAVPGNRNPNAGGNHRKSLRRSVESSLKRLDTDYIDILWVHAWDELTPIEETMRALDDLVRAGKVLYLGISNAPAWVVATANTHASLSGQTLFSATQSEYNILERTAEHDLIPMANHFGMTTTAWSPLASGILSGKYSNSTTEKKRLDTAALRSVDQTSLDVAAGLESIANSEGCQPAQLAINWLRSKPNVIPLIGARTTEQFANNIACLEFEPSKAALKALDDLNPPVKHYPQSYLHNFREVIHGGFATKIDGAR